MLFSMAIFNFKNVIGCTELKELYESDYSFATIVGMNNFLTR